MILRHLFHLFSLSQQQNKEPAGGVGWGAVLDGTDPISSAPPCTLCAAPLLQLPTAPLLSLVLH